MDSARTALRQEGCLWLTESTWGVNNFNQHKASRRTWSAKPQTIRGQKQAIKEALDTIRLPGRKGEIILQQPG
jgi:hypothetical protein